MHTQKPPINHFKSKHQKSSKTPNSFEFKIFEKNDRLMHECMNDRLNRFRLIK